MHGVEVVILDTSCGYLVDLLAFLVRLRYLEKKGLSPRWASVPERTSSLTGRQKNHFRLRPWEKEKSPHFQNGAPQQYQLCNAKPLNSTTSRSSQLFTANLLKGFCHRRRAGGRSPPLARLRDRDKDQGHGGSLWLRCLSCIRRRTRPLPGASRTFRSSSAAEKSPPIIYLRGRAMEMRWRDRDNGAKWTQWWKTPTPLSETQIGNYFPTWTARITSGISIQTAFQLIGF